MMPVTLNLPPKRPGKINSSTQFDLSKNTYFWLGELKQGDEKPQINSASAEFTGMPRNYCKTSSPPKMSF